MDFYLTNLYPSTWGKFIKVVKTSVVCQEENCDGRFHNVSKFRTDLNNSHEMKGIEEFEKYSDFQEWMTEMRKLNPALSSLFKLKRKRRIMCTYIFAVIGVVFSNQK
ncbi:unnamed protein product [Larinioides sclopetarius]|uniref:Uncharacterized protein n=1 Tax=Larinioides sclopetarius TaxID=280406 RepID=A0AAV1ZPE3_9ARAC